MYDVGKVTDKVTYDKIVRVLDEFDIYSYYSGKRIKYNQPMTSPLRKDNNPSFSLFRGRNGRLMYKDFATNESGDIIKFVQSLFRLTYREALNKIWKDLVVNGDGVKPRPKFETGRTPSKKDISIKRKNFTKTDDKYWEQYGIERGLLNLYNVFPILAFWINGIKSNFKYTAADPMYAYKIFAKFKIYRPMTTRKADKWRTNCTMYDIQGFEQLPEKGDLLVITKSLKDVMVLHAFGIAAVSPPSEMTRIPDKVVEHLKLRFKKLIVLYDNDDTGITGASKITEEHGLESVYIPKHYNEIYRIKDISDFRKEMGREKTQELLNELLNSESKSEQESS